jgi:proteasome lid subunit RPN8/RPN11
MEGSQERSVRFQPKEATSAEAIEVPKNLHLPDFGQYRKTLHRSREENRRSGDCDVWILQSVYRQVVDHLTHDTSREHGGLLLGYEIDSNAGRSVMVAHSLPANHTKGSPVRLEIKEDSWAEWDRISDRYTRDHGWRRIGWYHSHPGIRIFLSRWDLDVCRDWERPTHVALVVDPVGNQGGFFVRGEEGFRSDSPQSFFEIHNVSSRSIVTWSNIDPQAVIPETEDPLKPSPLPEPADVSAKAVKPGQATSQPILRRDRIWVDVTIVTLLLLLLGLSSVVVWLVGGIPREPVNLQPLTDQIGQLRADISRLRFPSAAVTPSKPPPTSPPPSNPQPSNAPQADIAVPPRQVPSPPPALAKLAIAKKPTTLRPSEPFQFKVNGNPPPEVTWSSDGPGTIDPFYGLYRAPSQFTGEAKVKVTATSRTESQSVTFTLKGTSGASKQDGKKAADGANTNPPDGIKQSTDTKQPGDTKKSGDTKPPTDNTDKSPPQ